MWLCLAAPWCCLLVFPRREEPCAALEIREAEGAEGGLGIFCAPAVPALQPPRC